MLAHERREVERSSGTEEPLIPPERRNPHGVGYEGSLPQTRKVEGSAHYTANSRMY
jgi:hypothetical protein